MKIACCMAILFISLKVLFYSFLRYFEFLSKKISPICGMKENPLKNIVSNRLLLCTCELQRCHCDAQFKLHLQCIKGLPYQF